MLAALCLALSSTSSRAQQPPVPPPPATATTAEAPAEAEAPPSCSDCHEEQATAFVTNAHGRGKTNAVCESCHGDGAAHMEAGGDTELIVVPRGLAGADKACLACHEKLHSRGAAHANSATVNCLTCHSIHKAEPRAAHLLAKSQLALCATCHGTQPASLRNKPHTHRIGRAGMECSSCHEPHGRTRAGELPCLGCHIEKRGPYVFQHAAGDCLSCHEAHGSSNPRMLKRAAVAQLCSECHSPIAAGTVGSQPPSFHNLSLPRYQNCTSCHVAVHGSNRDPRLLR